MPKKQKQNVKILYRQRDDDPERFEQIAKAFGIYHADGKTPNRTEILARALGRMSVEALAGDVARTDQIIVESQ
jgi:hypothetical protein